MVLFISRFPKGWSLLSLTDGVLEWITEQCLTGHAGALVLSIRDGRAKGKAASLHSPPLGLLAVCFALRNKVTLNKIWQLLPNLTDSSPPLTPSTPFMFSQKNIWCYFKVEIPCLVVFQCFFSTEKMGMRKRFRFVKIKIFFSFLNGQNYLLFSLNG